ncbi:MAG: hypothetical protein JWM33_572 [Caulobacteraceae bacterium]|nr:hypothetical protein [Caulobacteraceae bacterium]
MRRSLCLLLLLALTAAAPAPPGRPLWWRVSDGRAVLWILATPDRMMHGVKWDDSALRKRVAAADRIYYPSTLGGLIKPLRPLPPGTLFLPMQSLGQVGPQVRLFQNMDPYAPGKAVRQAPPALLARFKAVAAKFNWQSGFLLDSPTSAMASWLDLRSWPQGLLGNDPAWELHLLTQKTPKTIIQMPAPSVANTGPASQAVQEACLTRTLDEVESGQLTAVRVAATEAWARGDLEHALKRSSDLSLCLMGNLKSTNPQANFERAAYTYYTALDDAFEKGGTSVTVLPFDPLLADGGILAHYSQLGYEIRITDGMGD